jgi:hypothetical protein
MTGPNLGGRREGAGRPQTRFVVRVGDKFLVNRQTTDGGTMPELWTVIEAKRNLFRLQEQGSGDTMVMMR